MPAAGHPLRILFVEDNPLDLELIIVTLQAYGLQFESDHTHSKAGLLALLDENQYDLILADHNLPGFDGLAALRLVRERRLDCPFIMVSGAEREEISAESLRAGATEFILKDHLERLGPVVVRALREHDERLPGH